MTEKAKNGIDGMYGVGYDEIKEYPRFGLRTTAQAINLHKALTIPFCLLCMFFNNNWTLHPALYTVLHGSYTICYLISQYAFPPKNFEIQMPFSQYIAALLSLAAYWIAPWIVASRIRETNVLICCLSVALTAIGTCVCFVSQAQLYFTLANSKPKLISSGMFKYSRNPNYVGEVLIYSGFALMSCGAWQPWVVNLLFWLGIFLPNAAKKDKSLSRHEGWEKYKQHSGKFFPGF